MLESRVHRVFIASFFCYFAIFLFAATQAGAQEERGLVTVTRGGQTAAPSNPEQKTALVIGNGAYDVSPLQNPVNDARSVAIVLRGIGFDVTERENLDQKSMKQEIQNFGETLQKGGVGIFYFAGHGMQVDGRNYLMPVGAKIEHEKQVEYEAVDAGAVLAEMEHARNRMNIVILDACRDNPFGRSFRSNIQGLASIDAPSGTLIAYATAPGSVASDGDDGNGVYTKALVKYMQSPGLKVEDVFKRVRTDVRQVTDGKQTPWESSSLEGDFYFIKPPTPALPPSTAIQPPPPPPAPGVETPSRNLTKTWKEPVTGMEFVWVPGGCFMMGSPDGEAERDPDEGPVHQVCVDGFWMGKTEVTNGQFRKFQPSHDSKSYENMSLNGDSQPVVYVSWDDAEGFTKWLKGQNGGQYEFRLPSEAEWEYAARAGQSASRYWGDDPAKACGCENVADETAKKRWAWDDVHQCDDSYAATAPVGSFQANGFGLYDMLGNVCEWCNDIYSSESYNQGDQKKPVTIFTEAGGDAYRVIRGGNWHSEPDKVRSAARGSGLPGGMNDNLGFRVVRQP
jgi:formylglycine-generating enzyme required for sulfatase activity